MTIQLQMEPQLRYLTNVNLEVTEEEIVLTFTSGNEVRRYVVSPKHAKRLHMLLSQEVEKYEKIFGELKTVLPAVKQGEEKKSGIGFGKK